jgi:hypothetical protein
MVGMSFHKAEDPHLLEDCERITPRYQQVFPERGGILTNC